MFDITDIRPADRPYLTPPIKMPPKVTIKPETEAPSVLGKLSEDFEKVEKDPKVRGALELQKTLEQNRELDGKNNHWSINDFSDLRGKFNREKADEQYAKDLKAGLVEEDPENDEFIG